MLDPFQSGGTSRAARRRDVATVGEFPFRLCGWHRPNARQLDRESPKTNYGSAVTNPRIRAGSTVVSRPIPSPCCPSTKNNPVTKDMGRKSSSITLDHGHKSLGSQPAVG